MKKNKIFFGSQFCIFVLSSGRELWDGMKIVESFEVKLVIDFF